MNKKNLKYHLERVELFWRNKPNCWKYFPKYHYCRRLRTMQEIRENEFLNNFDEESKMYGVRSRFARNHKNLPNSWDDYWIYLPKSWKDATKLRKQWMVNL